jgi:hypothetical protein
LRIVRWLLAATVSAAGCLSTTSLLAGQDSPPAISNFAFVMPEQWFVLPGSPAKPGTLQFRRFSVAMHKADFDSVRSGATDKVQIIGAAGTFYNSMIYTCQSDARKSDFLTFHFPADASPASFGYSDWKPRLNISVLANGTSTTFMSEYLKGDIFADASAVGIQTFLSFVAASDLVVSFGEKDDRLNLFVADKFATMNLSAGTKQMLPDLLHIKPSALPGYSNQEMVKRCLQYKRPR